MAIDLSGMFKNLGSATEGLSESVMGSPVPKDPNQRNAMQRRGVTNPLLQQFGMGLGGAMGMDMRSNVDIASEEASAVLGGSYEEQMAAAKKLMELGMTEQALKLIQIAESRKEAEARASASSAAKESTPMRYVGEDGQPYFGWRTSSGGMQFQDADGNIVENPSELGLRYQSEYNIGSSARHAGEKASNTSYGATRAEMLDQYVKNKDVIEDLRMLRGKVGDFTADGLADKAGNWLKTKVGFMPADHAQAKIVIGEYMYSRLKPLFGGVISDDERKALEELYDVVNKGGPEASAKIDELIRRTERAMEVVELYRGNKTLDDFNDALMLKEEEEKRAKNATPSSSPSGSTQAPALSSSAMRYIQQPK